MPKIVDQRQQIGQIIKNHGVCCAQDKNEMSCLKFGESHALVIRKLLS